MNKIGIGFVVIAVLAVVLATSSYVYAQAPTAGTGQTNGYGVGIGGRGNQGNGLAVSTQTQDGYLHDGMIAFYADKFGLTVDELNARLANGETISQIALANGYTYEQLRSLMIEARNAGIAQSVDNGTVPQTQAGWMNQRGVGTARTAGTTAGMGVGRGAGSTGLTQFTNPDCPYTQVTP